MFPSHDQTGFGIDARGQATFQTGLESIHIKNNEIDADSSGGIYIVPLKTQVMQISGNNIRHMDDTEYSISYEAQINDTSYARSLHVNSNICEGYIKLKTAGTSPDSISKVSVFKNESNYIYLDFRNSGDTVYAQVEYNTTVGKRFRYLGSSEGKALIRNNFIDARDEDYLYEGGLHILNTDCTVMGNEVRNSKAEGIYAKDMSSAVVRFNEVSKPQNTSKKGIYLQNITSGYAQFNNVWTFTTGVDTSNATMTLTNNTLD